MFENLKQQLITEDSSLIASRILSEMAEGGAVEDDILDNIIIPHEEEAKIEALLQKIPDDAIGSDENITDTDMAKEVEGIPDPTLDELLDGEDF